MFRFVSSRKRAKAVGFLGIAWTYVDAVGKIWSQEGGGYFNAPSGQIGLYVDSAPFAIGGGYFNRQ